MLSGGVKDWNPKCCCVARKYHISLDADILVSRDTGDRSALVWHHNLYLMLGASCSLEVSETILTKCRNQEETEEIMASHSSKEVSNSSGVVMSRF